MLGKARLRVGGLWSDLGLAALATASIVLITSVIEPSADDRPLDALGYTVMIPAGAALVGRRARPVGVTAVVTASLAQVTSCGIAQVEVVEPGTASRLGA